MSGPTCFTIKYERGGYYVSVPGYDGGEVVTAEHHRATIEALVGALEECKAFLRDLTDPDAAATGTNIIATHANAVSLQIKVVNALAEVKKGETP